MRIVTIKRAYSYISQSICTYNHNWAGSSFRSYPYSSSNCWTQGGLSFFFKRIQNRLKTRFLFLNTLVHSLFILIFSILYQEVVIVESFTRNDLWLLASITVHCHIVVECYYTDSPILVIILNFLNLMSYWRLYALHSANIFLIFIFLKINFKIILFIH